MVNALFLMIISQARSSSRGRQGVLNGHSCLYGRESERESTSCRQACLITWLGDPRLDDDSSWMQKNLQISRVWRQDSQSSTGVQGGQPPGHTCTLGRSTMTLFCLSTSTFYQWFYSSFRQQRGWSHKKERVCYDLQTLREQLHTEEAEQTVQFNRTNHSLRNDPSDE